MFGFLLASYVTSPSLSLKVESPPYQAKKPSSPTPQPKQVNAKIARIPINAPVETEFRQDTDAYFLVTTTRRITKAPAGAGATLKLLGFAQVEGQFVRQRRKGVLWKASKEGYQAVPGNVPVLSRINFFAQKFGSGTQEVDGALVRTDGTIVKQEISNYSVQSGSTIGYETVPFPWQNLNGSYTWMAFDRPVDIPIYQQRTSVSNKLGAPVVPTMPFPLPSKFTNDTRFSLLLEDAESKDGVQTIFKAKQIYREGDTKYAEGTLNSANDLGPQVSGVMIVDLSTGTLHRLSAKIEYDAGTSLGQDYGPYSFSIDAERSLASRYKAVGLAEFERINRETSISDPFDGDLIKTMLGLGSQFSIAGISSDCILKGDEFAIRFDGEPMVGKWTLPQRTPIFWFAITEKGLQEQLGHDTVGFEFLLDIAKRTLTPHKMIYRNKGVVTYSDKEPLEILKTLEVDIQSATAGKFIDTRLPGITISSPEVFPDGFVRVRPSVKFLDKNQAVLQRNDRPDIPAEWRREEGIVIVTLKSKGSLPTYILPTYRFRIGIDQNRFKDALDLNTNKVWSINDK